MARTVRYALMNGFNGFDETLLGARLHCSLPAIAVIASVITGFCGIDGKLRDKTNFVSSLAFRHGTYDFNIPS